MLIALLARALVPVARAQLASSPWPMFHHDLRHTGLSQFGNSAKAGALEWKADIGSGGLSSSAAVGAAGTIYVGSGALDAINADGSRKWRFYPASGSSFGLGSSPAVGADGVIYVGSEDADLYAINPDGSQKWTFTTAGPVYSSPAVGTDGTIYVGSEDANLYAINPDGSQKWRFDTSNIYVFSSPAVGADGTIYVGSGVHLYAVNPDGSQKWQFTTGDFVFLLAGSGDRWHHLRWLR